MDNKKLMHILLRDVIELEQLVGEFRQNGNFDALEQELLLTRISGVRHLLEVACNLKEAGSEVFPLREIQKPEIQAEEKHEQVKVPLKEEMVTRVAEPAVSADVKSRVPEHREFQSTPVTPGAEMFSEEKEEKMTAPDMSLEDEPVLPAGKHILADRFVAGKSVNDLLLERSRSDLRFSNMPLSSLASAIGTNERFLFTRELFEGNMDSFNDTILKLDSLNSIQEAADFLRDNFKWKKSETSLRFIDLVKRRFAR